MLRQDFTKPCEKHGETHKQPLPMGISQITVLACYEDKYHDISPRDISDLPKNILPCEAYSEHFVPLETSWVQSDACSACFLTYLCFF